MARSKQLEQLPGMHDYPDEETITALVEKHWRKREVVSLWPRHQAVTVLAALEREKHAVECRRAARDGEAPPPWPDDFPDTPEDHARALEWAMTRSDEELLLRLSHAASCLPEAGDWRRRVAGYFVKIFRNQCQ